LKSESNIDVAYYLNTGIARIGAYGGVHVVLVPWHFVLMAAGYAGLPWEVPVALATFDLIMGYAITPLDFSSKFGAFALGRAAQRML
jgi:hypothetical protein